MPILWNVAFSVVNTRNILYLVCRVYQNLPIFEMVKMT
jgi:hypothetical protein